MTSDSDLSQRLAELSARHQRGEMGDAVYAAAYFLSWQIVRHGGQCASRRLKTDPKPNPAAWWAMLAQPESGALLEICERYQFRGVIVNVPVALAAWLRGDWPLTLMTRIPSPEEVLTMQTFGTRPVTVIADYTRALQPVLTKADGFAFLIHDLEHAWKFFYDPRSHRLQRRFFQLLRREFERGVFEPYRRDPLFAERFDYLMSDMNTHVVHSLRFLAAVLIECLLRREGKTPRDLLTPAGEAEVTAFLHGLAESWAFPGAAVAALGRSIAGGFTDNDAARLEQAVEASALFAVSPQPRSL